MSQAITINGKDFYKHPFISNYLGSKDGDIYSLISKKKLSKNRTNGNGYLTFAIYEFLKPKNYYYHRFIWEVFNGEIPKFMEVDHRLPFKYDNRITNLQLLTHKQNNEKSHNKSVVSTNIKTGEEKIFNSLKAASEELDINISYISRICKNKNKTSTSKKDGCKYTFKYNKEEREN